MKKKIFAGVLAAAMMMAAVTGCGNSQGAANGNDGEYVLSARVFPENTENGIYCEGEGAEISVYNAGTTVKDDFVIFPEQAEK